MPVNKLLANVADERGEQMLQTALENFTNDNLMKLGNRMFTVVKQADVVGIDLTHGTDMLKRNRVLPELGNPHQQTHRRSGLHARRHCPVGKWCVESFLTRSTCRSAKGPAASACRLSTRPVCLPVLAAMALTRPLSSKDLQRVFTKC